MFAPPRSLSQRTTSFIASQRQGIHHMPLRHLIALIIDTHASAEVCSSARSLARTKRHRCSHLEKTSLLRRSKSRGCGCRLAALARKQKTNTASVSNSLAAARTNARVICLFTMSKISPLAETADGNGILHQTDMSLFLKNFLSRAFFKRLHFQTLRQLQAFQFREFRL